MWEGLAAKQVEERWWRLQEPTQAPTTSMPESLEDTRASLSQLGELMFPVWGLTGHVT
jgi:hypothetical protein